MAVEHMPWCSPTATSFPRANKMIRGKYCTSRFLVDRSNKSFGWKLITLLNCLFIMKLDDLAIQVISHSLGQLAFLTLCNQAFNPPFLGGKIIELAKFCFMNKRFETKL